jgi:hypothetical protein
MATGSPKADAAPSKELPKYQLLETSYINETLYDPEREPMIMDKETGEEMRRPIIITFTGKPGPHMKPVNAAAKAMYEKYPPSTINPIDKLTIVGPGAEVIESVRPTA